ncbi:hypothetical protein [Streptomyces sp. BH055]|uniref:hypothetical protein n=1 Tax=Streptomyces sp. BH055 TaxID=3401173 RepID=UPI003BB49A3E
MITDAIASFLTDIVKQVTKPVRELLADTLLSTPDITEQRAVARLWAACLALAAGLYVLFVTAGGVTVMGYETVQNRYALKQIAPRLLVGMIAAATSKTVMSMAIDLANALSAAVMGADVSDAEHGLVEQSLRYVLVPAAGGAMYLVFLNCLAAVMVIAVLMGYIVRVAVIALLAVSAPLVLSCHAHPVTDGLARMWWRALAGCLSIQVAQSMVFILGLKLFFAPGNTALGFPRPSALGTLLAGLAMFWVLFKIPGWTTQLIFRPTPISPPGSPGVLRMLKSVALVQLMNAAAPGAGAAAGGRGGGLNRLIQRGGRPGPGTGGAAGAMAGGGWRPGGGGPRPAPGGRPPRPGAGPGPGANPGPGTTNHPGPGGGSGAGPSGPGPHRGPGSGPSGPGSSGPCSSGRPAGGAPPAMRGSSPRPPRPTPPMSTANRPTPPRAPAVPPPPRRIPRTPPGPHTTATATATATATRPPVPTTKGPPSPSSRATPPATPPPPPRAPRRDRLPRTPIPRANIRPARPMPLRLPLEPPPPHNPRFPRRPTR